VKLKAVLLQPLVQEVESMRALARSRSLVLRLDPHVDPTLGGNRDPLKLRVTPEQGVTIELADSELAQRLAQSNQVALRHPPPFSPTPCSAGHFTFNLDPQGRLMPCMLARQPLIDASVQGFASAWQELGQSERVAVAADSPCASCQVQYLCSHCPALGRLDERPLANQQFFDCELARLRSEVLKRVLESSNIRASGDDGPRRQD
jgi:radical SAM protein with 4Fe4S-binding SPASM domain